VDNQDLKSVNINGIFMILSNKGKNKQTNKYIIKIPVEIIIMKKNKQGNEGEDGDVFR